MLIIPKLGICTLYFFTFCLIIAYFDVRFSKT